MIKDIVYTIVLILISYSAYGQSYTIKGKVIDSITGNPLIGATVIACDHVKYANENGEFQLEISQDICNLQISYIGYSSISISNFDVKSSTVEFPIYSLEPSSNILEQTVITASRYAERQAKSTVSLKVINEEEILRRANSNIDAILDQIPGLDIIDGQANIRGGAGYSYGAGSRVLLVIDGMPALQFDGGFPNWSDVLTETVSRVEVLKSASSVMYGAAAMNGVINVITKKAPTKPETKVRTYYRHFFGPEDSRRQWWDTLTPYELNTSIYHGQKIGNFDLQANINYNKLKSFNQDVYHDKWSGRIGLKYFFSPQFTIRGNLQFNTVKGSNFFYWGNALRKSFQPSDHVVSKRNNLRINNDLVIDYYSKNDNKHTLKSRNYYVDNDASNNQGIRTAGNFLSYQYIHHFSIPNTILVSGMDFRYNRTNADLYGGAKFTGYNAAIYSQWTQSFINDKFVYRVGWRYEFNQLNNPSYKYTVKEDTLKVNEEIAKDYKPVFNLGINYQPFSATYLRASWGQGYRYPTIAESFTATSFGGFNIIPNPSLISETGWTAEVGVKQEFKWQELLGFIDLALFQSRYNDMMEFALSTDYLGVFQAQNIGDTDIHGLELAVGTQYRFHKLLINLGASYSYLDPKYREFTEDINKTTTSPNNILKYRYKHSFKSQGTVSFRGIELGITQRYLSHMEAIDQVFNDFIPGINDFRSKYNEGFIIWNVSISLTYKKILLQSNLDNVFNVLYTERPGYLEAPRNLAFKLGYTF